MIDELAEYYKAFADPTRLKIIKLLSQHEILCVNGITRMLDVSQSAVSQHLRVLRQCKLVIGERLGPQVHYKLNHETLKKYRTMIGETLGSEF